MPTKKKTPTLYKAVRPNGTDFYSGSIDYAAALAAGETIKHPRPSHVGDTDASGYISVTNSPMDIPGARWPLRLFEVEVVGDQWSPSSSMVHKVAGHEVKILREVPAHLVFGPEGERVGEIVTEFNSLSMSERDSFYYHRPDGFYDAWYRVRDAAVSLGVGSCPARFDLRLRVVSWRAGLGGALALLVRGLDPSKITDEDYETLTAPWRALQGPVSPKDNLPALGFTPRKTRAKK